MLLFAKMKTLKTKIDSGNAGKSNYLFGDAHPKHPLHTRVLFTLLQNQFFNNKIEEENQLLSIR